MGDVNSEYELIIREYFPYDFVRPGQDKIIKAVIKGIHERRHVIINASTGVGKTVAIVAPLYYYAFKNNLKIFYLTRTVNQGFQALLEFERVANKASKGLKAVGFQGRYGLCAITLFDKRFEENISYDEFKRICDKLKEGSRKNKENAIIEYEHQKSSYGGEVPPFETTKKRYVYTTCPFYTGHLINKNFELESLVYYPETLFKEALREIFCPYEFLKEKAKEASMIVLPYIYIFEPKIRQAFLKGSLGIYDADLRDYVVVVDEAHNLPDYLRELMSDRISIITVRNAIREAKDIVLRFNDLNAYYYFPVPYEGLRIPLTKVLSALEETLIELGMERPIDESYETTFDHFIEVYTTWLSKKLEIEIDFARGRQLIYNIAVYFSDLGELIRDKLLTIGKRPRSYIGKLGDFFVRAYYLSSDPSVHFFVERNGEKIRFRLINFDAEILARVLENFYTSIHMSGTLKHFESYRVDLGLENTIEVDVEASFIEINRAVFYYPRVTTRYEDYIRAPDKIVNEIQEAIYKLLEDVYANTIVLFPSYEWLERIIDEKFMTALDKIKPGRYFIETKDKKPREMHEEIETFKKLKKEGAVFFGVFGGRLGEGMNFPHDELRLLVIVGLPYPKPDAYQRALLHYYALKYGEEKAWEYAYESQMIRKILQALGRLVRDETDFGIAVILDSRAKRLKRYIKNLLEKHNLEDIALWLKRFEEKIRVYKKTPF